jgi:hypothetical protein
VIVNITDRVSGQCRYIVNARGCDYLSRVDISDDILIDNGIK